MTTKRIYAQKLIDSRSEEVDIYGNGEITTKDTTPTIDGNPIVSADPLKNQLVFIPLQSYPTNITSAVDTQIFIEEAATAQDWLSYPTANTIRLEAGVYTIDWNFVVTNMGNAAFKTITSDTTYETSSLGPIAIPASLDTRWIHHIISLDEASDIQWNIIGAEVVPGGMQLIQGNFLVKKLV